MKQETRELLESLLTLGSTNYPLDEYLEECRRKFEQVPSYQLGEGALICDRDFKHHLSSLVGAIIAKEVIMERLRTGEADS